MRTKLHHATSSSGSSEKNIDVDDLRTDDHRLARIVVQRVEALLVTLGQFEFQTSRQPVASPVRVVAARAQVALKHRDDHVDEPAVFLFALRPDAGAFAVAQVVLQADRIFSLGDLLGARLSLQVRSGTTSRMKSSTLCCIITDP